MIKIVNATDVDLSLHTCNAYKIFLAGSCAGEDWRATLIDLIQDSYEEKRLNFPITIFNPLVSFDYNKERQIIWEYEQLKKSNCIAWWLSKDSPSPLSMFELGRWGMDSNKSIIIGMDDDHKARQYIGIQTELQNKSASIVSSLESMAEQILR